MWSLAKYLAQKPKDLWVFLCVCALMTMQAYMNIQVGLLTGGVMTMLSDAAPTAEMHHLSKMTCDAMGGAEPDRACSAPHAIILAFVVAKLLEQTFEGLNIYVHHNACEEKRRGGPLANAE